MSENNIFLNILEANQNMSPGKTQPLVCRFSVSDLYIYIFWRKLFLHSHYSELTENKENKYRYSVAPKLDELNLILLMKS